MTDSRTSPVAPSPSPVAPSPSPVAPSPSPVASLAPSPSPVASLAPSRFRLLATFLAHRSVDVVEARAGEPPYTNGLVVFVSKASTGEEQCREVLLQSALLGAGSLDPELVKSLRAHPLTARRYLALEGRRVLADLAAQLPLAAAVDPGGKPSTTTARESLEIARGRTKVADPPAWFGAIRPARLVTSPGALTARAEDNDMQLKFDPIDLPEADDDEDEGHPEKSKILKLFEAPTASQSVSDFLRKLFGSSRSPSDDGAGAELQIRSVRRVHTAGAEARPLPAPIRFDTDGKPGAALGIGGAWYPEWDVHHDRYRPDWCRVIDFPLTAEADVSAAGVQRDDVLRRRLSRIGLGPRTFRGRPDGDEMDIEALIDLFVDLRSGHSPPENVYLETRKLARNLGVLILVDASGSATDTDSDGLAVHDHQRRAAGTLAATLEGLGDRVAVYAFRSQGRHTVHLPAIKTFDQRFGALERARLNQLQPWGYTRLGAGIRGAGEILKADAGTPNRLLVLLSDGYPYDDGYEGRYAEADASKALAELRADGVACLCLSLGADTATDALGRVFGSASYASAATLADLSPRMDELFLASLRELAAPVISAR